MPDDKWDVQEPLKGLQNKARKGSSSMGPREKPMSALVDFSENHFDKDGKYIPQKVRDKERRRAFRESTLHPKRRKLFGRF